MITAEVVVNASGPWTDLTNAALGRPTEYMGGTKGSHIVLDNPALLDACKGREMFFENDDGRIVLIYPLKGKVMVGTTDLEADMSVPAVCTDEEIDYFIELVAHVFPDIAVERSQIVYSFSGVRPLPHHDDTQPGFVSRDYRIVPGTVPGLGSTTRAQPGRRQVDHLPGPERTPQQRCPHSCSVSTAPSRPRASRSAEGSAIRRATQLDATGSPATAPTSVRNVLDGCSSATGRRRRP